MLSSTLRYFLKHPVQAVTSIGSDPFEAWTALYERFVESREAPTPAGFYEAEDGWEPAYINYLASPGPVRQLLSSEHCGQE